MVKLKRELQAMSLESVVSASLKMKTKKLVDVKPDGCEQQLNCHLSNCIVGYAEFSE